MFPKTLETLLCSHSPVFLSYSISLWWLLPQCMDPRCFLEKNFEKSLGCFVFQGKRLEQDQQEQAPAQGSEKPRLDSGTSRLSWRWDVPHIGNAKGKTSSAGEDNEEGAEVELISQASKQLGATAWEDTKPLAFISEAKAATTLPHHSTRVHSTATHFPAGPCPSRATRRVSSVPIGDSAGHQGSGNSGVRVSRVQRTHREH